MSSFASPIVEVIPRRVRCTSVEYDVDFKAGGKNGEREVESFRDKLIGEMKMEPTLRLVVGYLVKDSPRDKI